MNTQILICERCPAMRPKGERFCPKCRRAVREELRRSGYLQWVPRDGPGRPPEARENRTETKHGVD